MQNKTLALIRVVETPLGGMEFQLEDYCERRDTVGRSLVWALFKNATSLFVHKSQKGMNAQQIEEWHAATMEAARIHANKTIASNGERLIGVPR